MHDRLCEDEGGSVIGDTVVEGVLESRVEKPWGWEQVLRRLEDRSYPLGPDVVIKMLCVRPRGALSVQSHKNRAEEWQVITGIAHVLLHQAILVCDRTTALIRIGQGVVHSVENRGEVDLMILEVSRGRVDPNDITRYKDKYGRV